MRVYIYMYTANFEVHVVLQVGLLTSTHASSSVQVIGFAEA